MSPPRGKEGRFTGHLINVLVTLVTLFVAIKVSDGGFANSIDKITKNLDVALRDLRSNMPTYENYTDREVYYSNVYFNPKGMAGLYNLTNKFIESIIDKDFLMKGAVLFDSSGNPYMNNNIAVADVFKYYWVLVTIVLLTVLITLFLPLCGFCFCCCRCCCGRCGARSRPADKRRDLCKKIIQGTLLIILGTAMLFCVVCAFASNQQLEEGITQLSDNLKTSKKDTNTYLESTKKQTVLLLDTNYKSFSSVFTQTITESGEHVTQQLTIWSNATAMTDLNKFVMKIPHIKESLESMKNDTQTLRILAVNLDNELRNIRTSLITILNDCSLPECGSIKNNISQLQTTIDYEKLPDVKPTIEQLDTLDTDSLESAAQEGIDQLHAFENKIRNHLNNTLEEALVQVDKAGNKVKSIMDDVTGAVRDVQSDINKTIDPVLNDANKYIKNYHQYRYYGGLAISCVLLLVTICIALGLVCGICGKRPDGYSDNCCNKGAGGQFLICAVMIMFIFGFIIGVVTLAMLALGLTADRGICYPIRHPDKSTVMEVLDQYVAIKSTDFDISLSQALLRCYQNQSIYNTFNWKNKFDIDTVKQNFDITPYLDQMTDQLNGLDIDLTILSEKNEGTLKNLSNIDISINLEQFQDELDRNITNLSLKEITSELNNLINLMGDKPLFADTKAKVQENILKINECEQNIINPIKETANRVIVKSQQVETDLKMNSTSFSEAIDKLIDEIKDAQEKLNGEEGTNLLRSAVMQFAEILENQINSYIDRVVYVTKNELGQCGPLNVVINATLTATCDKIVLPWNGFWVTLFLSLLIFIPTIIISVKLASLYQKYKQYGHYIETEYLYDAYADRDNIPLNSRAKRGGKKKKKGKKYEDRPQNMGGEVVTREYATGSHPTDARYSDMAPKHWEEFPNGGPPQYQRAPTEYERPPPYYYPGSGDQ